MNINTLYLDSLLNDSLLPPELAADIRACYNSDGMSNSDILDKADKFVYFDDSRNTAPSLKNILHVLSGTEKTSGELVGQSLSPDNRSAYAEIVRLILSMDLTSEEFCDQLLHLQRFFISERQSGGNPATISRFEYIKSRAAFAQCLAHAENEELPFIIMCGDLSGIQDFIYNIHNSRAYKSIKGRSFYLQLIVEAMIGKVLEITGQKKSNVIYSSGGKFYLILPNSASITEKIQQFERDIQSTLFDEFQLGLYVCLGWIPFNIGKNYQIITNELKNTGEKIEGMGDLWGAVSDKAARQKNRRYEKVLLEQYELVFTGKLKEDYNGQNMAVCAVSGMPVPISTENNIADKDDSEPVYVHPLIRRQTDLGKSLQRNNTISYGTQAHANYIEPLNLGITYCLTNKPQDGRRSVLLNPASVEDYKSFVSGFRSAEYLHYGGNVQAENESGELLTLEEIASSNSSSSMNKIGILKMDVDGLGDIFTNRMNREYSTFASMSGLSSRLDWFFCGYINQIRNENQFKNTVNIIYSGGDDLCAIGRWDSILEFASRVRSDFRIYAGGGDRISISAGYGLFGPKFPVSKAIHLVDQYLDEAKEYRRELNGGIVAAKPTKNAIHLLGLSVGWDSDGEWKFVNQLRQLMAEWLQNEILTKGVLYKLHSFKSSMDRNEQDWHWHSAYHLGKIDNEPVKEIQKAIYTGQFDYSNVKYSSSPVRMFNLIILSAKLADYQLR
jgi:CRISPR-associated protein Csm1